MIIKSIHFYHTEKHDPYKVVKCVCVIEKQKSFLKPATYKAKILAITDEGIKKEVKLGGIKNHTEEYENLDELSAKLDAYMAKFYNDAINDGCLQVISPVKSVSSEENPLEFSPPDYTPDESIMHDRLDNPKVKEKLDKLIHQIGDALAGIDSNVKYKGMIVTDKDGNEIANTLKQDSVKVPLSSITKDEEPVPIGTPESQPASLETLNKNSEEYEKLCQMYGKENVDELINRIVSKQK